MRAGDLRRGRHGFGNHAAEGAHYSASRGGGHPRVRAGSPLVSDCGRHRSSAHRAGPGRRRSHGRARSPAHRASGRAHRARVGSVAGRRSARRALASRQARWRLRILRHGSHDAPLAHPDLDVAPRAVHPVTVRRVRDRCRLRSALRERCRDACARRRRREQRAP